jgi:hypothetical protein
MRVQGRESRGHLHQPQAIPAQSPERTLKNKLT